jgi:hypothetical protein
MHTAASVWCAGIPEETGRPAAWQQQGGPNASSRIIKDRNKSMIGEVTPSDQDGPTPHHQPGLSGSGFDDQDYRGESGRPVLPHNGAARNVIHVSDRRGPLAPSIKRPNAPSHARFERQRL